MCIVTGVVYIPTYLALGNDANIDVIPTFLKAASAAANYLNNQARPSTVTPEQLIAITSVLSRGGRTVRITV